MSDTQIIWIAWGSGAFLVAAVATALLSMRAVARQERIKLRMWEVARAASGAAAGEKPVADGNPVVRMIQGLGAWMMRSGILSESTLNELQETLANTKSLSGAKGLSIFVGIKCLLVIGVPIIVVILGRSTGMASGTLLSVSAVSGVVGLLAPDFVLKKIRKNYLRQVEAGLPDALDLLVICAEAGLGLEPAIERVSQEIAVAHAAVANELVRTCQDLRMVADRKVALLNIGKRTGLECMERLAITLVQSTQLGTPLTRAFRTISAELRQEALTKFEGRAARLPVLLTVPMILFILPCVFIVVAGPAGLQVMRSFH
jgi:tight adherence protein C